MVFRTFISIGLNYHLDRPLAKRRCLATHAARRSDHAGASSRHWPNAVWPENPYEAVVLCRPRRDTAAYAQADTRACGLRDVSGDEKAHERLAARRAGRLDTPRWRSPAAGQVRPPGPQSLQAGGQPAHWPDAL